MALGFGYVVQVWAGNFAGFGESVLAVPGLPSNAHVEGVDILVGVAVAIVVALLAVIAFHLAQAIMPLAARRPLPAILVAGAAIAAVAIAVATVTDLNVDTALFFGQSAMTEVLVLTSVGTLALTAIGKMIAYGISLGAGFLGGRIFPAVFIGVVAGTAASVRVATDAAVAKRGEQRQSAETQAATPTPA